MHKRLLAIFMAFTTYVMGPLRESWDNVPMMVCYIGDRTGELIQRGRYQELAEYLADKINKACSPDGPGLFLTSVLSSPHLFPNPLPKEVIDIISEKLPIQPDATMKARLQGRNLRAFMRYLRFSLGTPLPEDLAQRIQSDYRRMLRNPSDQHKELVEYLEGKFIEAATNSTTMQALLLVNFGELPKQVLSGLPGEIARQIHPSTEMCLLLAKRTTSKEFTSLRLKEISELISFAQKCLRPRTLRQIQEDLERNFTLVPSETGSMSHLLNVVSSVDMDQETVALVAKLITRVAKEHCKLFEESEEFHYKLHAIEAHTNAKPVYHFSDTIQQLLNSMGQSDACDPEKLSMMREVIRNIIEDMIQGHNTLSIPSSASSSTS